jgi:hypothetical protein
MDKAEDLETVDEHLDPATLEDVMSDAADYDVAGETQQA